jgi:hypothetical protein
MPPFSLHFLSLSILLAFSTTLPLTTPWLETTDQMNDWIFHQHHFPHSSNTALSFQPQSHHCLPCPPQLTWVLNPLLGTPSLPPTRRKEQQDPQMSPSFHSASPNSFFTPNHSITSLRHSYWHSRLLLLHPELLKPLSVLPLSVEHRTFFLSPPSLVF